MRHGKLWVGLAALFMLLPVPVMQFVGEEGLMAVKSYEMFVRHDWWHPSILGGVWPHSPLWHWPVIALCGLIGWEHVDVAMRLVSVAASWLGALTAGLLARWLYGEAHPKAGWLAALVYLTLGEVSFWYGWLGYVDALFGMFIFAATATLWRAVAEERAGWFLISLVLVSLAFMTKNITAYAFYGAAGLVLLWRHERWRLLTRPWFLGGGMAALTVPALWQWWIVPAGQNTASTTLADAWRNFSGFGVFAYLKHWLTYPFVLLFRALPVSLLAAWAWWRERRIRTDESMRTAGWIVLLCFLPFWLSAGGSPRYLVPLYGMVAMWLTGWLLVAGTEWRRSGVRLMALMIVLKVPYSLVVLPYIKDWRPERDVKQVTRQIMEIVGDSPVLTENDVATGLAIAAYLDVWRRDAPYVRWNDRKTPAYVLAEMPTPALGVLVRSWRLRGDVVYLYRQSGVSARRGGGI